LTCSKFDDFFIWASTDLEDVGLNHILLLLCNYGRHNFMWSMH